MREPNTEEMTMSKFYAAVGGDLSDVLERLEDLDIVKFYLPEFENDPSYEGLMPVSYTHLLLFSRCLY